MFMASAVRATGMLRVVQQPPGTARIGELLTPAPQVQLFDAYGYPSLVAGVPVTVDLGSGSGSVTGTLTVPTSANGRATFPGLAFSGGVEGARELRFSSAQRLAVYSAPVNVGTGAAASAYAITLRYLTGATSGQAAAFESARARIGALVTGDVPDAFIGQAPMPDCGNTPMSEVVDDLLIWVELRPIDGYGGLLGQAGPCVVRSSSKLPAVGIMRFDTADLQWLESAGQLDDLILHEMLHVVGFGSLWRNLGLASGLGTSDPIFTGLAARLAYVDFDGGVSYGGLPVPVENTGEAGTRDSHWRESVFGSELMTGWLSPGFQPLSRTTIASLGDLGYAVDLSKGEALVGSSALRSAAVAAPLELGDDLLRVPVREVPEL
jgi:leishmanolysin